MTPAVWVETARVSTARRLLETGRNAPKQVAYSAASPTRTRCAAPLFACRRDAAEYRRRYAHG